MRVAQPGTETATRGAAVKIFVRRFHTEIIAEWKTLARTLPAARQMNAIALVDHIPEMLEQIGDVAAAIAAELPTDATLEMARRHAIDRLQAGFSISTVVDEMSMLRGCIFNVWARENANGDVSELRALNLAIDQAVSTSVTRYAEARDRTLDGIDRISTAALESRSLDDLLGRLLRVFVDTSPAVDTAAIFLVDGDRLRLRAAVGLDEDLERGFSVAIGDGFAGTVAAERKPIALRSAYLDPLLRSDLMRDKKVRALYGIPLVHGDELVGVAHMGSVTANELSHEDRQVFGSMSARATMGIIHHMLRQELADLAEERERALSKLESLLAASPVGIAFIDRHLRYIRINDALAQVNGRPVADHIGKSVGEMVPDNSGEVEPMLGDVLATGKPLTNLLFAHHDRSYLANYFPMRSPTGTITGIGAIVIDVTDEKRAQEALRVEQARLQSILDHAPTAIWIKDLEGRIVLANERLAEALGHPLDRIIGRRSDELLPPDVAEQHRDHDVTVMREQRAIEVEEEAPAGGGVRTFLSIKFPIPSEPPLIGAIATEITERKKMEDDLRVAVRTREDVLAIVSHDLRNPLGTVQLSVSMLQGLPQLDHRVRRHLELIHRATLRMEGLIDDLLDTANIRAARLVLDTARESVESVVNEALDLQEHAAVEKGLRLVRSARVAGIEADCDRDRLLQVFGNLIGNAIKFCRAGDTITVTGERDGDVVRLCVADTGPGIAPDILPYLFDAYWSGTEHAKQGAGLGLYISRGIIEGHGGRIWVESMPGQGATFCFTLPIAR